MANSQTFIVGNLAADPELRFTQSGQAVCQLNVAVNERYYDTGKGEWADRDATFYRCNVWRQLAENCAESLNKGDRVVVVGDMRQRSYEKDGDTRYTWELEARAVGCELSWAIARTKRVEKGEKAPPPEDKKPAAKNRRTATKSSGKAPAEADPWEDEPPF